MLLLQSTGLLLKILCRGKFTAQHIIGRFKIIFCVYLCFEMKPETVEKIDEIFESRKFHLFLLTLIVIDFVIAIISFIFLAIGTPPGMTCYKPTRGMKIVEKHVFYYISVAIITVFYAEMLIKIYLHPRKFFRDTGNVVDFVVVTVSFILLIVIYNIAPSLATALLLVRIWRVVRFAKVSAGISTVALKEKLAKLEAEFESNSQKIMDLLHNQPKFSPFNTL